MALHGQLRAEQCLTFTAPINQTEPNAVDVEKWFLFNFYRQQTELREGNVSQVSVCQSFCPQAAGTSHASWDRSYGKVFPSASIRHHTSPPTHPRQHTWEHTSPLPSQTSDLDTYLLLLTSGGHHWRPVQTCSFEGQPPPVLTTSDGHRNMYSWQVDGTHRIYLMFAENCRLVDGLTFTWWTLPPTVILNRQWVGYSCLRQEVCPFKAILLIYLMCFKT